MIKSFFETNNIEYKVETSLKKHNTYRLETICKYLVFPNTKEELIDIIKELRKTKTKYLILGNGSNIIFANDYYDGVIIKLDKLNKITYDGNEVTAEAGTSLIKLANETIEKGLSGLTFATAIPGTVGASTAMNAGAYKSEMADVVKSVQVLNDNLEIISLDNKSLKYSYRDSLLKSNRNLIVLSTTFMLSNGDTKLMKEQVQERRIKRMASQPLDMPSAGSVFRNPEGMFAGELIEKAGLKGYQIGGAKISEKHANFIVNAGSATGKDILELINIIKKKIKEEYNVELILEQIIIE